MSNTKFTLLISRQLDYLLDYNSPLTDLILEYYNTGKFDNLDYMVIQLDSGGERFMKSKKKIKQFLKLCYQHGDGDPHPDIGKLAYASKSLKNKVREYTKYHSSIDGKYSIKDELKLTDDEVKMYSKYVENISRNEILKIDKMVNKISSYKYNNICFKINKFSPALLVILSTLTFVKFSHLQDIHLLEVDNRRILVIQYETEEIEDTYVERDI